MRRTCQFEESRRFSLIGSISLQPFSQITSRHEEVTWSLKCASRAPGRPVRQASRSMSGEARAPTQSGPALRGPAPEGTGKSRQEKTFLWQQGSMVGCTNGLVAVVPGAGGTFSHQSTDNTDLSSHPLLSTSGRKEGY